MGAYKTLLTISNQHAYFTGGKLTDWQLVPSPETARQLRRFRMIFKQYLGDYLLSYQADASGDPMLTATEGALFHFYLYVQDPAFINYTDLPAKPAAADIYYVSNSDGPGTLSMSSLPIRSHVFEHAFTAGSAVTVQVENHAGTTVFTQDFARDSGDYAEGIDLSGQPEGRYRVLVKEDGEADQETVYYIKSGGRQQKPLAVLEWINSGSGALDYNNPQDYLFDFDTKAVQWTYHIMLSKDYPDHEVQVQDLKEAELDLESPYPTLGFKETTGESDLTQGKVLRFVSVEPDNANADKSVPFYQEPNKDLQVVIVKGKGNNKNKDYTYIKNIPNPRVGDVVPEVFINI